jgi:hypothetical protein
VKRNERPARSALVDMELDVAGETRTWRSYELTVRAQNVALRAPETIATTIRPATASRYHTNTE